MERTARAGGRTCFYYYSEFEMGEQAFDMVLWVFLLFLNGWTISVSNSTFFINYSLKCLPRITELVGVHKPLINNYSVWYVTELGKAVLLSDVTHNELVTEYNNIIKDWIVWNWTILLIVVPRHSYQLLLIYFFKIYWQIAIIVFHRRSCTSTAYFNL